MESFPQKKSLREYLNSSKDIPLNKLRHLSSADTASLLLKLNKEKSDILFQKLLQTNLAVSTLSEMKEPHLKNFLRSLTKNHLIALFSEGPIDDLVYIIHFAPEKEQILKEIPPKQSIRLKKFMAYPEDSSGRIMQDDYFSVPLDFTTEQTIESLREYSKQKFIHYIYCTDQNKTLLGILSIRELVIAAPDTKIKDIINQNVITISPKTTPKEAAEIVSHHNYIAIPVVDNDKKMLGLITVDDVLDIISEQATAKIYAMAGLPEDDHIYTNPFVTIRHRLPWLIINLFFAVLASSIISLFEQTMSRLIILATLKNIVAGIGGNTAIQTLTVTTRGLDTGDFNFTTVTKALLKEVFVGLIMGIFMGLGASIITYFWKGSILVSIVIFIAMMINSLVAVLAGFLIPLFMRKLKKDPAVSSGVLVTIITDIFGFFIFLSTASLGLKFIGENL